MTIYLFDWGNTLMKDSGIFEGKMSSWPIIEPIEGANSVLHFLSKHSDVYIATNASDSTESDVRQTFEQVGLAKYIKGYFCKQNLGIDKSEPAYFRTVIEHLNVEPSEIVMIGDSFEKDVEPALQAGINAIWLNSNNELPPNNEIDQIQNLFELISAKLPLLENNVLRLEPPSAQRNEEILSLVLENKDDLATFLPWVQNALTLEDTELNSFLAYEDFRLGRNELRYSIIDKTSNKLIGMIGLMLKDSSVPRYEIGYWLGKEYRSKGFMTSAVGLIETLAFESLGALRVDIRVAGKNEPSQAVAVRCGYKLESVTRLARRNSNGSIDDEALFCKLVAMR